MSIKNVYFYLLVNLANMLDDHNLKLFLAENININISTKTLNLLIKDAEWSIRASVAENSNTPVETLKVLAKDTSFYIRFEVTYNSNTPIEILKELINDENEHIKQIIINRLIELKGLNSFV